MFLNPDNHRFSNAAAAVAAAIIEILQTIGFILCRSLLTQATF